jgi:hypothetical protein
VLDPDFSLQDTSFTVHRHQDGSFSVRARRDHGVDLMDILLDEHGLPLRMSESTRIGVVEYRQRSGP